MFDRSFSVLGTLQADLYVVPVEGISAPVLISFDVLNRKGLACARGNGEQRLAGSNIRPILQRVVTVSHEIEAGSHGAMVRRVDFRMLHSSLLSKLVATCACFVAAT
ncbi:unnamed protein product, partial [Iphiclides podalirius]